MNLVSAKSSEFEKLQRRIKRSFGLGQLNINQLTQSLKLLEQLKEVLSNVDACTETAVNERGNGAAALRSPTE